MNEISEALKATVQHELQSRPVSQRARLIQAQTKFRDLVNRGLIKPQEYDFPGIDETERHFFQLNRRRENS